MHLFDIDFNPREITGVALCSNTNTDIRKYCDLKNIKVVIFPKNKLNSNKKDNKESKNKVKTETDSIDMTEIKDIRNEPDTLRFGGFKRGWNDALDGKLYNSIKEKKTHSNIGNLFGWIYGNCSEDMKEKVWNQYIKNSF